MVTRIGKMRLETWLTIRIVIFIDKLALYWNQPEMFWRCYLQKSSDKVKNRLYFHKILSTIKFLARQGLSLRGDGDELQSNFYQLMLLLGQQCPEILSFSEKKQLKYTSHEIQNEILSIMAQAILRRLVWRIQSSVFSL